ncbi:MAG: YhgE/Pip domain-containing protein [Mogibacterium sp.]|nr:YhgE/Pip domain-containing protein [Mogibacterium sp.]
MRTVLSIFRNDIMSLCRRFFALAIIVAISVLPALYAWVNIYANGNPYANTGEIQIAVASLDPGLDLEDGTHINMAEEVSEDLKTSDKIGWQFPDSAKDAVEGVRSGKYYAAVVFEDNFTYNMYHFEQALLDDKAPLTYYENQKRNAIAPKITETAATTLQQSIKTKYLERVFGFIFDETNEIADELSEGENVDDVIARLEDLRDTLRAYDSAISEFTGKSDSIHSGIKDAKSRLSKASKSAGSSASSAGSDLRKARNTLEVLKKILSNRENRIEKERAELEKITDRINADGISDEEREALKEEAGEMANTLKSDLEGLLALFPESKGSASIMAVRAVLSSMISDVDTLTNAFSDPTALPAITEELKKLSQESLSDSVDSLIATLDRTVDLMEPLMKSMSSMLSGIDPVLDSADKTVSELNSSLLEMQAVFSAAADKIDDIIARVDEVSEGDKLDLLIDLLGGDPEAYAKFFSSLVDVEVEEVYSVASYGAAMAPFYSVLAIWVGGVILVSILKTHIDKKKFPGATETQEFFGRFILFFLIGQLQAAVIVAGDIFLLGCQPVHPWMMWFSAAVTSFVFVLLIYALTISFGDVGKAIVVVVMVLQIAGSSGSYPIEILPPVFGKIYKFFPFPHAINAMREALCGTYRHDFALYLAYLLIFAVVALAIGLLIRRPFLGMNRFVSEKIEETEVL